MLAPGGIALFGMVNQLEGTFLGPHFRNESWWQPVAQGCGFDGAASQQFRASVEWRQPIEALSSELQQRVCGGREHVKKTDATLIVVAPHPTQKDKARTKHIFIAMGGLGRAQLHWLHWQGVVVLWRLDCQHALDSEHGQRWSKVEFAGK